MLDFDMINKFYNTKINNKRLWSIDMVKKAVELGVITEEEYKRITNETYTVE